MKKSQNQVFIIMGVSGCGKSAVTKALADELDAAFLDGDYLHPKSNILKMRSGNPLNDDDRAPWLTLISNAVFAMSNVNPISLIICSALKKKYRDLIRGDNHNVHFLYLKGSYELIEERLNQRKGHFQKTGMLQSQFDALEEPTNDEHDVFTINIDQNIEEIVNDCVGIIKKLLLS